MGIFDSKPSPKVRTTTVQKPKKVVISVGNNRGGQTSSPFKDAREIIQDARDEAFRIKKAAEEEVRKLVLSNLEEELQGEIAKRIKEAEEKIKAESSEKAKEILVNSMIAGSTNWAAEYTVSTVKLESDDIKGR